jgi:hypothetical protein
MFAGFMSKCTMSRLRGSPCWLLRARQAVQQRGGVADSAHGGVQAVAVTAGFDRVGQPARPGRPGQVAGIALQFDGREEIGEHRGEQPGFGRQARPVQPLARQAPLHGEDGAAGLPRADVFGRWVASPAQAADQADKPPLVAQRVPAARDQLDDQLVSAGGNHKRRTRLPRQHLIHDLDPFGASHSRYRVQQPPVRPGSLAASHALNIPQGQIFVMRHAQNNDDLHTVGCAVGAAACTRTRRSGSGDGVRSDNSW